MPRMPAFAHAVVVSAALMTAGPSRAAVVFSELNLGCGDGDRSVAFVELRAIAADTFDPAVGLLVTSASGQQIFDLRNLYGARRGAFEAGGTFLVATAAMEQRAHCAADVVLPAAPDSIGGRLLLYRLAADGVTRVLLTELRYGLSGSEAPSLGWSLQRFGSSYANLPSPSPQAYQREICRSVCFGTFTPPPPSVWRIRELGLRCRNGDLAGGFVELQAASATGRETSLGVRVLGPERTVLFDLPAVLSNAPTSIAPGATWLLAMAGGACPPDHPLASPLEGAAGSIQLYRDLPTGIEIVDSVQYGAGFPVPDPGFSLEFGGGAPLMGYPSPTNHAGQICASDCFASTWRIEEFALTCADGTTPAPFVELKSLGSSGPDTTLGLRGYDGNGAPRFDIASVFEGRPDSFAAGASYLLAMDGRGCAFDRALPISLDAAAGTLQLYRTGTSGVEIVDELRYGPGFAAAPSPGKSLRRVEPGFAIDEVPTPRLSNGVGCETDCYARPLRLREVSLECADRSSNASFLELGVFTPRVLNADVSLELLNPGMSMLGRIDTLFRAHLGDTLGPNDRWLIAGPALLARDGSIPADLGLGGFLRIRRGEVIEAVIPFGSTAGTSIPPGLSWSNEHGAAGVTYEVTPTSFAGQTSSLPACFYGAVSRGGYAIDEIVAGCASDASSYVAIEVRSSLPNNVWDSRLGLRVLGHDGSVRHTVTPLFTALGAPFPDSARWLVGTSEVAASSGPTPDRTAVLSVDPLGGSVVLFARDVLTGGESIVDVARHGPDLTPFPQAGYAIRRAPHGGFELATADLSNFAGERARDRSCFVDLHPERLHIGEVLFQCRNADIPGQFVELVATGPGVLRDSTYGLSIHDAAGRVLLDRPGMFGTSPPQPWPTGRSVLLATRPLGASEQARPDQSLGAVLDTLGGEIRLYRTIGSTSTLLSHLRYGPGGESLPPRGMSLRRGPEGWSAGHPSPTDSSGMLGIGDPCWSDTCAAHSIVLNSPPAAFIRAAAFDTTDGISRVTFDLAAGTFRHAAQGAAGLSDVYVVDGAPPGTPVTLRLKIEGTGYGSTARLHGDFRYTWPSVFVQVANGAAAAYRSDFDVVAGYYISVPVHTRIGEPFRVILQTSVVGVPSPHAYIAGRLTFDSPTVGLRVRSCHGFDRVVDAPVAAQVSLVSALVMSEGVQLRWFASSERPGVELERSEDGAQWTSLSTLHPDGEGYYGYLDPVSGSAPRLAYRLAWEEHGVRQETEPIWVERASRPEFALRDVRPNPSRHGASLDLSVDRASPVELSVFDVAGRVVHQTRLETLTPGRHVLPLTRGGQLPTGLYYVRVRQDEKVATKRFVVAR